MSDEQEGPQPGLDLTPEEAAAAEAAEAEPLMLKLPPQLFKAVLIYEREDGAFGFRPLVEGMQVHDIFSLCQRAIEGARADFIAAKVMESIDKRAAKAKENQPSKLLIPRRR